MKVARDGSVKGVVRTYDLSKELLAEVREYQHGNAMDSRISAVRQMLHEAYLAWKAKRPGPS